MMENTNTHLMQIAMDAAIRAGNAILKVYAQQKVEVTLKPDETPVTVADQQAHEIICSALQATGLPVLSEEGTDIPYEERRHWKRFWLVDPLDGTKEFIKRNDEFTVNIALIENGVPIEGVIYVPVTRELYFTGDGAAFKTLINGDGSMHTVVQLPAHHIEDECLIGVSRSHMNKETETYINSYETGGKPLRIVRLGSSLKLCRIAEGTLHCYPKLGKTMEWDTAAGQAILAYSGKNVLNFHSGEPLQYNKPDVTNPWFIVQ